ncbi:MAG: HDIG domain-containing protein [Euryarchaeota archaeon]|nr:HDIG domain-containing protein [Euryarchaeota archaeon]
MNRDDALALVRTRVSKENNVKHMIAVGAVMREAAIRLGEDPQRWELVGILHDIDFEICSGASDHTLRAAEILRDQVDLEAIEAIMAHNFEHTKIPLDSRLKRALIACDAVSGLIIACALVMPSKKLAEVKHESLMKKYNSKDFARNVSRERISICVDIGLPLDEFLSLSLEGMKKVAVELCL